MKKSFSILIITLLFISGPVLSQKQLYFGLAGAGLSSVIINQNNYGLPYEMDYTFTLGGGGNANIGFDFNNHMGLKLEIGWAKLGQKYDKTYNDTTYTRNVKLNYLQIPLLFKYRTGGEVAKFYVMAGPQFNLLLSASQKYYKNEVIFNDSITQPNWNQPVLIGESTITDRYNSLDIMGRLDLGVDFNITANLCVNVGMTMAYGFMDINASDWQIKDNTGNYNPSHNLYGGINFGINYLLPIGTKK